MLNYCIMRGNWFWMCVWVFNYVLSYNYCIYMQCESIDSVYSCACVRKASFLSWHEVWLYSVSHTEPSFLWMTSKQGSPAHISVSLTLLLSFFYHTLLLYSCIYLRNQANLLNTTNISTETILFMLNFRSQSLWQHITMLWDLSSLLPRRHFEVWG